MRSKKLYLFVEGDDDERFFKRIVELKLKGKYEEAKIIKYAEKPNEYVESFIRSIKSIGADYLFFADIDRAPCITKRKQDIKSKLNSIDLDRIVVVKAEIESWYLAGLDDKNSKKLKIKNFQNTDNITKEQFNSLMPKKFDSRIDFMIEILNNFSIEVAKTKNSSFKYFVEKHC
ncbi:MAG: hypothetical protein PWQ22_9 [Archaeoglobaceae archaeon]|nr:hypothetical protein [Archaeoglobaceae archaeon]MDK2875599.1 hypothetical protein [Archaeoglobaceae archaeon]